MVNGAFAATGISVILACVHGNSNWVAAQVGYGLFGLGSGSTYANTWLFLEEYFKVLNVWAPRKMIDRLKNG